MAYEIGEKVFIRQSYAIGRGAGPQDHVGKEGVVVGRFTWKVNFVTMFVYEVLVDDVKLNLDERHVTNVKDFLV